MRTLLLSLLLFVPLCAQQPPPPGQGGPRGPRPEPKNLKILKVSGEQIGPIMRNISASLGVQCDHCHVRGDFASDDNPKKEVARHMMTMTQEINAKFPDTSKRHVGCFTCHRGEKEPQVTPPAAAAPPKPAAQ
jgi:hypothetical protein